MKISSKKSLGRGSVGDFHNIKREIKTISYQHLNNSGMNFMEERLFSLKIQEIIEELTQIMMFIKELEKFGFENSEVLTQIHNILLKLHSGDRNYKYTKIIHVLTKYLSGIRDLASTVNIQGVIFYKRLFESTLVAIIRELDSLEEEVY